MATMNPGSKFSYAAVAVGAAMLGAGAMWSLPKVLASANAQPASAPGQVLTQPLSDLSGREVRMNILDRDPGAASARHRHPGHHIFGYVLEGTYEFAINGDAPRLLKAGEAFYEPPTALQHDIAQSKPRQTHSHPDLHGGRSEEPEHCAGIERTPMRKLRAQ